MRSPDLLPERQERPPAAQRRLNEGRFPPLIQEVPAAANHIHPSGAVCSVSFCSLAARTYLKGFPSVISKEENKLLTRRIGPEAHFLASAPQIEKSPEPLKVGNRPPGQRLEEEAEEAFDHMTGGGRRD